MHAGGTGIDTQILLFSYTELISYGGLLLPYVTVSAKTRLVRTTMCIKKIEIKNKIKICMLQRKIHKFISASTLRRKPQIYIPSYSPAHGELCFISVAPTVCVSRAFVYNTVNINEIFN